MEHASAVIQRDARDVFADHSLRCTRQRVEVYRALAATKSHPTADELHRTIQECCPGISLATVYNTLEALCGAGLTRKIAAGDGPARYDADVSDHLHVVTREGGVLDLPEDLSREIYAALPADLRQRIETRLGARVERVHLEFSSPAAGATITRTGEPAPVVTVAATAGAAVCS